MFKVVSFNINGIRARPHQVEAIREHLQPDVLGLQECKVADEQFPQEWVREVGYQPHFFGQKGHYGVALLSLQEPTEVVYGFPHDLPDAQRRIIIGKYATAQGNEITIINGYFPQGESRQHETKFPAKRKFYADLLQYLQQECQPDQLLLVMGDMNVAPLDADIGIGEENAKRWLRTGKCSFLPEEREWYEALQDWGLVNAYRQCHPDAHSQFSWFDYRSRGFEDEPKRGLMIDHMLITKPLQVALQGVGIDYSIRGMEKPSDHCPVWASFAI